MRDMICPRCNSGNIVKNGNTAYGKPKFMCWDCRKSGWSENYRWKKGSYRENPFQKNL